jgi:16S rRNA (uracil1498-N3)-methyltransferase
VLRLFVPRAQFEGDRVRITGAELRHLRTLRLGPGAHLVVFDEAGDEHEVRLERLGGRAADAAVVATHRPVRESPLDLVLAPALLKGAKTELVIEKATELGVRRIVPFRARHAIGCPPAGDRLERWRRIALAAAKQSGRTRVPEIEAPAPLATVVRRDWPGLRLVAWEGEHDTPLVALPAEATAVVVVVGPEGGLADDEVADARAHGFVTVTLASRILRAETAALAAVVLCQHRWGDLSGSGTVLSSPELVR